MSRRTFTVSVNPSVLKWARESTGVSIEEAAKRVRTSVRTVESWEGGTKQPSLRILEELARSYKRPLAAFFLPAPPVEPSIPPDCRVIPGSEARPLSRPTLLAVREARRLQALATELTKEMGVKVEDRLGHASFTTDPEILAQEERKRAQIGAEEQSRWRNSYVAFSKWRQAVERVNVLVFQIRMPLEELRGFSFLDGGLPAIVVNASDCIKARIFTLFHEYAHLLLGGCGICLPDETSLTHLKADERFCNHFAGAFLVPKDQLRRDLQGKLTAVSHSLADQDLVSIAASYKVSKQVIWRRMQLVGLISTAEYQARLKTWQEAEAKRTRRKPGFGVSAAKRCILEKGPRFASMVFEAKDRELITYRDMADYLAIRVKYLDRVQSLLGEQA